MAKITDKNLMRLQSLNERTESPLFQRRRQHMDDNPEDDGTPGFPVEDGLLRYTVTLYLILILFKTCIVWLLEILDTLKKIMKDTHFHLIFQM